MKFFTKIVFLLACGFAVSQVQAQEFTLTRGGNSMIDDPLHTTYSWQIQFTDPVSDHFGFKYQYKNNGHFADYHPDGYGFSAETHWSFFVPEFSLSAALGPYIYADTYKFNPNTDVHGVGGILSLAAKYQLKSNWVFSLETDVVKMGVISTVGLEAGIGYNFGGSKAKTDDTYLSDDKIYSAFSSEFSVLAGKTIVNVIGNGRATGTEFEWRKNVWEFVDVSVGALSEGKNELTDRYGALGEVWLKQDVLDNRLSFSIGGGPYLAVDKLRTEDGMRDDKPFVTGVFSMAATFNVTKNWALTAMWHRVFTDYNRDSDVIFGGVTYQRH